APNVLRRIAAIARKRDPSAVSKQLAPEELQIAALVPGADQQGGRGAVVPQPRTVDYHPRKVFTKLGIASRTDSCARPRPSPARLSAQDGLAASHPPEDWRTG